MARTLFTALILLLLVLPAISVVTFSLEIVYAAECPKGTTGAGGFVPLECFQDSAKLRDAYQNTEQLGPFLQKIFVGAISLGAILAVLRLAWAGFLYMGSDQWSSKGHAKEVITDVLLGLFLLLAIWLILYQINPQILELRVDSDAPASTQSQTGDNWFF
jgi:hypothetical protein